MSMCTRTKAVLETKTDGSFSLYDDQISGKILELETDKKITQLWKMKDWKGHSTVTIEFKQYDSNECEMTVKQVNIPADVSLKVLKKGWNDQIFKPMSILLGFPIFRQD